MSGDLQAEAAGQRRRVQGFSTGRGTDVCSGLVEGLSVKWQLEESYLRWMLVGFSLEYKVKQVKCVFEQYLVQVSFLSDFLFLQDLC